MTVPPTSLQFGDSGEDCGRAAASGWSPLAPPNASDKTLEVRKIVKPPAMGKILTERILIVHLQSKMHDVFPKLSHLLSSFRCSLFAKAPSAGELAHESVLSGDWTLLALKAGQEIPPFQCVDFLEHTVYLPF